MEDALKKLILTRQSERAELAERLRLLDAEIDALETANRLRPIAVSEKVLVPTEQPVPRRSGGRRPGDISHTWRNILAEVHRAGSPCSYEEIAKVAEGLGHSFAIASVRDRVRNLVNSSLMTGTPAIGFQVTQDAVERFGFTTENGDLRQSSEAMSEGVCPPSDILS